MADQPKRFSLATQIAEVERELALRASTYPRLVSSRAMSEAEAEMHSAIMRSTLETLQWLQKNENAIKAARENNIELWAALRMVREAVETHMPAGALPAGEHVPEPTALAEGEALALAIVAIATGKLPDRKA